MAGLFKDPPPSPGDRRPFAAGEGVILLMVLSPFRLRVTPSQRQERGPDHESPDGDHAVSLQQVRKAPPGEPFGAQRHREEREENDPDDRAASVVTEVTEKENERGSVRIPALSRDSSPGPGRPRDPSGRRAALPPRRRSPGPPSLNRSEPRDPGSENLPGVLSEPFAGPSDVAVGLLAHGSPVEGGE